MPERYRRSEDALADLIRENRRGTRDAQRATGTEKAQTALVAEAALEAADAASETADGKSTVVRSASPATGAGSYKQGDQWWQFSGANIVGLWLHSGAGWVAQELTNAIIATLDAGKITTGILAADRIGANSITAAKLSATAIDGMTITGALIRTAASGQRMQFDVNGLRTFNASNVETSLLESASGVMRLKGAMLLGEQGNLGMPPQISGGAYHPGHEFTHETLGASQASGQYSGSSASISSQALASNQMGYFAASVSPTESRINMDARDEDDAFPHFPATIVRSIDKSLKVENAEGPLILTTSRSSPLTESSIIIGTQDENSVEVRATNVDFNGGFGENAVVKVNGYAIPTEEIINLALTTNLTLVSGTTLHESSWLRKRSDGYVYGTLAFYRAAGFTSGATIATLAAGYRPIGGDQLPAVMWGAGSPGRAHFQMGGAANGVLIVWSPPASTQYVSAKVMYRTS